MNSLEPSAYIVKAIPVCRRPADDIFRLCQVVDYAETLHADDATAILEELVHLAAHLDLRANPLHNDLAGTALAQHFFDRRFDPFEPPKSGRGLLVVDLVRSYVHVHKDAIWPQPSVFAALRRLGFEVARTRGRWRPSPYQNLWQFGSLAGSHPRSPLAVVEGQQEPIRPIWTNPPVLSGGLLPLSDLAAPTRFA